MAPLKSTRGPYKKRKLIHFFCVECGQPFVGTRFDAGTCSDKCRKRWERLVKSDQGQAATPR